MKVYRVERQYKSFGEIFTSGPYEIPLYRWTKRNHLDKNHPTPYKDYLISNNEKLSKKLNENVHKFGFTNKKQLIKWFTKTEIKKLSKFGYYICEIEIHEQYVHEAKKQCIFAFRKVKNKKILSIEEVYGG